MPYMLQVNSYLSLKKLLERPCFNFNVTSLFILCDMLINILKHPPWLQHVDKVDARIAVRKNLFSEKL